QELLVDRLKAGIARYGFGNKKVLMADAVGENGQRIRNIGAYTAQLLVNLLGCGRSHGKPRQINRVQIAQRLLQDLPALRFLDIECSTVVQQALAQVAQ